MSLLRIRKGLLASSFAMVAAVALSTFAATPTAPDPVAEYRSLLKDLPANIDSISQSRPRLKDEINKSYAELSRTCPALNKVDKRYAWNVADWMTRNVSPEEWKAAPYSFRINSFKAVAVQINSDRKTDVLEELYNNIDLDPAFFVWMDDGRERLRNALLNDPYLIKEKKEWSDVIKDDDRLLAYIQRIKDITYDSFLPKTDITERLKITINRNPAELGGYDAKLINDSISFNFSENNTSFDSPEKLDVVAIHEFFHSIQLMISHWAQAGRLDDNPVLKEAGMKFSYSFSPSLGYIAHEKTMKGYVATFHERSAFYVGFALNEKPDYYSRDPKWMEKAQSRESDRISDKGVLPSACFK